VFSVANRLHTSENQYKLRFPMLLALA
jgi:hypothetical protein